MKKTLILFDVDGTLTESRRTVKDNMLDTLKKLKDIENLHIGIVGGSNLEKQKEQLHEENLKLFKWVFSENGLVAFKDNEQFHSQNIREKLGDKAFVNLINSSLFHLSNINIPIKTGTFIETRTGMINLCPIGRICTQEERNEFNAQDNEHHYRENLVNKLKSTWVEYQKTNPEVCNLTFSIGGQISIDVFPEGWDKTYCLQFVEDKYERILFFGDKTDKGGNDYEIYSSNKTESYKVINPEDTIEKLTKLFNL